ncbi:hypothetical protein ACFL11_00075 [Patescibacteria group bacterium]
MVSNNRVLAEIRRLDCAIKAIEAQLAREDLSSEEREGLEGELAALKTKREGFYRHIVPSTVLR